MRETFKIRVDPHRTGILEIEKFKNAKHVSQIDLREDSNLHKQPEFSLLSRSRLLESIPVRSQIKSLNSVCPMLKHLYNPIHPHKGPLSDTTKLLMLVRAKRAFRDISAISVNCEIGQAWRFQESWPASDSPPTLSFFK
jgi:hypothetical protein